MKNLRKYLTIALIIGWAITIAHFFIQKNNSERRLYQEKRVMMGTFIEVISPRKEAAKIVFDEIERIEGLLSKYNPESEISRLNRLGSLKTSPETFYIIKKSKEFYSLTNGAFDITIAPLMDLWGFTNREFSVPTEKKIKETLKLIGSNKIVLHDSDFVIEFKIPRMKIDLGAIAKGYAVDCAVTKIKEHGIKSCLINAGGQIYCLGDKFGKPWRVAIKNPRGNGVIKYLTLENKAISTSGGYEQYFTTGGKNYAHIINPNTGYPTENSIASVTIIADNGLTTDALSTSVFVLGKKEGEILVNKFNNASAEIINK